MQRHQFDTIYHEHFSYLSLIAGQRIFAKAGLRVFDVELLETHGGSIRFFVCQHAIHSSRNLWRVSSGERAYGLDGDERRCAWKIRSKRRSVIFLNSSSSLKREGKKSRRLWRSCQSGDPSQLLWRRERFPRLHGGPSAVETGAIFARCPNSDSSPEAIFEAKPDFVLILP